MIVMYFKASQITCTLKIWFRELGFTVSYGALLLKTWRISCVFTVRSATQVRISDWGLIKRLFVLVVFVVMYLTIRTVWGRPTMEQGMCYCCVTHRLTPELGST